MYENQLLSDITGAKILDNMKPIAKNRIAQYDDILYRGMMGTDVNKHH